MLPKRNGLFLQYNTGKKYDLYLSLGTQIMNIQWSRKESDEVLEQVKGNLMSPKRPRSFSMMSSFLPRLLEFHVV